MMPPVTETPPSARTRYLIQALKNATLRNFVANVIAQERPADIAAPLAELLDDRSDTLRATAAQLLGSLNDVSPEVCQRLRQVARDDQHPIVRQNARESLQRLASETPMEVTA
jgi:hypothetical protein